MVKYSKQRELILNTVIENYVHPTADWVYEKLKAESPNLSLGTVYRNLNMLTKMGKIKKISLSGEPDRFDGRQEKHIHFTCRDCGEIFDLWDEDSKAIKELQAQLRENTGHELDEQGIVLSGTCKNCTSTQTL